MAKGAALYGLKESLPEEVSEILASRDASLSTEDGPIDLSEVPKARSPRRSTTWRPNWASPSRAPSANWSTHGSSTFSGRAWASSPATTRAKSRFYLCPGNPKCRWNRSPISAPTPNQAAVDIRVMAGERDSTEPTDCQEVGLATLNLPEKLPARSPIRVKFAINQDGRLNVSAIDLTAGGSIDVEFQTEAVLNAVRSRGAIHGVFGC